MRKYILTPIVIISMLFIWSCDVQENSDNNEKEVIKIGVIFPLSGELSSYCPPFKDGLELAKEEINKNSNYKINLIYEDTKGESKTGIDVINKMININNINYFIGDISSNVTLSMIPICEKNGAFLFSPGAASPKLTAISNNFARNYPSSTSESKAAAHYVFDEMKNKECVIVYVNNEWGVGLKDEFKKTYKKIGGDILFEISYDYENKSFADVLTKLKPYSGKTWFLAGNQREMGHFMKQMKERKLEAQVISNISFLEKECREAGGNTTVGVIVPKPAYNPNDTINSSIIEFRKLFLNKYEAEPSLFNAIAYDNLMLIKSSIDKNGNEPIKVGEYIRNLKNYHGAVGEISFTEGDVSFPIEFYITTEDSIKLIKEAQLY